MADFGPSGIEGLPGQTLDALERGGDPRVLGWLREAVVEGDRLNRSDPSFDQAEVGMRYVSGDQMMVGNQGEPPAYLPRLIINDSRRVVQAHVSALTDIKPLFAYKATNPAFNVQADLLNRLTVASWITQMYDVSLGDVCKYSLCAGTGDMVLNWDPQCGLGGDITMSPRDFRDTLPWRPATHNRSIQAWEGLILRESHSVNVLRSFYPEYADRFRPSTDSMISTLMGRFKQIVSRIMSPAADTLSGLDAPAMASRMRSGECLLYRCYLTDRSKNLTTRPIPMGRPGASWAYTVPPGGYLYPFKRLVICTPEFIVYDGPSPYWHGQFPVSRLKLWDLPWHLLGKSLLNDLIPIQNAINQSAQDILLGIRQWLDPTVVYNRNAVSETFMRIFDPRRTGGKVKLTAEGAKEGFKKLEGPAPQVLALAMQMFQGMRQVFGDLSGTPNFAELMSLKQLPAADTIQKYYEAMTPELRAEGRAMEAFLRELAIQMKCLRFQYESNTRRVTILGDAGQLLEDFDFDPEQMVPSMDPVDAQGQPTPGYQKEFDAALPRDARAMAFQKTIVFTLAPNSILSINATEQKMLKLQLFREGIYDVWSLWDALEIGNAGAPPPIPLPPLKPVTMADVQASQLAGEAKYTVDPMTGQILEIRAPVTIVERMMAQQLLGIGQIAGPAGRDATGEGDGQPGRKASGQAPPKLEQKSDGRTTVTESRHEAGNGPASQ